ncbi:MULTISPECIES: VOC family protein [unclassified Chamaesiphon]|uniref:VOC family protein n=1 Tax=unclassified Chamaesiphon TaxID=2620921 RepID=UPI00286A547B|nr:MULTISPECIES: VOC family protein [unclassified Chamaesiphon]
MPNTTVRSIGMVVADLERSIDFYTTVLGFTKITDRQVIGRESADVSPWQPEDLPAEIEIQLRVVELQLGRETIELTEFLSAKGRTIPVDTRSNDRWFQHLAIVVSDMHRAYQHLRQHSIVQVSPHPQTLPAANPVAGGIQAFYFRDPDGHNLKLIHFPATKGDPKWQEAGDALFLGIDHTAIVVSDTAASLALYRDLLGLQLQQESENFGVEQEQLGGIANVKFRISSLSAAEGIGIELVEYLSPTTGRPIPADTQFNDLWCWQTAIVVDDAMDTIERLKTARCSIVSAEVSLSTESDLEFDRQFLIKDPDGHLIRLADWA